MKLIIPITACLVMACASSQPSSSNNTSSVNSASNITPTTSNLSLADYLKRVPGVQVVENGSGGGQTQILVRGNNTIGENREPLFVINGVNVGKGYENAAPLVDINDVASVQVLKSGQETAPYGMQGTNGVIVIRTKKR